MSETPEVYNVGSENSEKDTKLLFMAKRLVDLAKDFQGLNEDEKKIVIEKADEQNGYGLVDLYNNLGEYME